MTTSMNTLPPRPDLGPPQVVVIPPQRRRVWPIVAAIAGGLIVLGVIGSMVGDTMREAGHDAVDSGVISSPVAPVAWDYNQAEDLIHQAGAELGFITATSAVSSDIQHIYAAADLVDQATLLVGPNDAALFRSMSEHLRNAATYISDGDGDSAANELDAIGPLIDQYENSPEG